MHVSDRIARSSPRINHVLHALAGQTPGAAPFHPMRADLPMDTESLRSRGAFVCVWGGGVQIQKRCMPGPWCMLVPKDMNVYSASVMLACCRMVMPLKQRSSSAHYVTRGWPHPRVAVIIHCHIYYNSKRWCLGEEGSTQCSRNIHKALIHPRVPFICHQRDLNSRLFITAASPPPNPHVKT